MNYSGYKSDKLIIWRNWLDINVISIAPSVEYADDVTGFVKMIVLL